MTSLQNATGIPVSTTPGAPDDILFARSNVFEVDLDALDHNVREIRRLIGPEVRLFAALKANAYGFGTLPIAHAVLASGADGLAVVDLRDAVAMRKAGIAAPIHLYGGMLVTPEVARAVDAFGVMPTVLSLDDAGVYSRCASRPIRVFVKIEVGLERFGIAPEDTAEFVQTIRSLPNLDLHGLCTHLHVPRRPADEVVPYLDRQFARFQQTIRDVEASGTPIPIKMAASSGSLSLSRTMSLNAVDPGHLLFGLRPGGPERQQLDIKPVMRRLISKLVHIHRVRRAADMDLAPFPIRTGMSVGVIPIGVVDGMLSLHCGDVLLAGRRCPVLEVSLEHTRIDVTDVDARVGDDVVIVGRQGDDAIEIADVLAHQNLRIPASVPLAVHQTVPRAYLGRNA
jgi:alanine racemase